MVRAERWCGPGGRAGGRSGEPAERAERAERAEPSGDRVGWAVGNIVGVRLVVDSVGVTQCPRASPNNAFAEYRSAGAVLRHSPRGDLHTDTSAAPDQMAGGGAV
ncbi:hypothetical protein GCM10011576_54580 [Micromonospora parathelypteridis]|nr:hypothetical protein GCM10011576_54580 [Micromonospora parathelypteridis]